MRSVQVMNMIMTGDEFARYTELQILKSAAGFYIGTKYNHPMYGYEPGSRDTTYFKDEYEAKSAFDRLEAIWKQLQVMGDDEEAAVLLWMEQCHRDLGITVIYRMEP